MRVFSSIVLLLVALLAAPASAFTDGLPPPRGDGRDVLKPAVPEAPRAELDRLFGELAAAPSTNTALVIETRIRTIWLNSAGPTVGLLIDWADKATTGGDYARALDCLDEAQSMAPDVAEVYYRRAGIHYVHGDLKQAFGDIETTLRIEPRHFAAMRALAEMLTDIDDDRRALLILKRLQDLDPRFEGLGDKIEAIVAGSHGRDT
jgi:tetratricopeptide (TPR) repeat protein